LGVYFRKYRAKLGKGGRKIWWLSYTVAGHQVFESSHGTSKRFAEKLLAIRKAEIAEGRWNLPVSNPPLFKEWAEQYQESIKNPNTMARYGWSIDRFLEFWGEKARLSDVASVRRIEEFKQKRLAAGLMNSSVNRDLSVLRRLLTLATRQRLIGRNPFAEIEFLEEKKFRRQPHILSLDEQSKLIEVAPPKLRALIFLITETGLRVGKEALRLKWTDVDIQNSQIAVRESKTLAGRRVVPLSELCRNELLRWRQLAGPRYSQFLFPIPKDPSKPMGSARRTWSKALKNAGIDPFPIYSLRATFASRLSAAGVPDGFVSQLLGHSGGLLQTYSKAVDEFRRDAIRKLERFHETHSKQHEDLAQPPTSRPN
jgi:integrase